MSKYTSVAGAECVATDHQTVKMGNIERFGIASMQRWVGRLMPWLFAGLSLGNTAIAVAADEDCMANGGKAFCTSAVPAPVGLAVDGDMWTYVLCQDIGPYLFLDAVMCDVAGGTWDVRGPGCVGQQPVFEPVVVPWARDFMSRIHNACQISNTDTGWGATINTAQCGSGGSKYQSGVLVLENREMDFQGFTRDSHGACTSPWAEPMFAVKYRKAACPEGYNTRVKTGGILECWYLPPSCIEVCSQVNPLRGNKVEQMVDYRAGALGGLEFIRYYNSLGYFQLNGASRRTTDYWRTNWDRRMVTGNIPPTIMGYAQRPDGDVKAFLLDGTDAHNKEGAGSDVLAKLMDGSGATIGWRLTTAAKDVELYDANGRLQSITARTGLTYALVYDGNGRLAAVADSFGRALALGYDPSGRLSSMTDPDGRLYQYGYDTKGRLSTVTYPDTTLRTHVYEDTRFLQALTGIIDENNQRYATWAYDDYARAKSSQHATDADLTRLVYSAPSATSGSTTVTDALGAVRTYSYQSVAGVLRPTQQTQPCPGCTNTPIQYTYDTNGNVASRSDFNGKKVCYAYDLGRNLESARLEGALGSETCATVLASPPNRPDVRKITTTWNPSYRLPATIAEPAPGGTRTTTFTYDASGNLTQKSIIAPANDGSGNTIARSWNWTFTSLGRVLTARDPDNNPTTYTYYSDSDPDLGKRGNVQTITNAAGHVTTITAYDAHGRPSSIADPNALVTTLAYDLRGRLTSRQVGTETTTYTYDEVGLLNKVTPPGGSFLQYNYDAAHRLTQINDGLDNEISYTLDAMGNRRREDVYDPAGQLARTRSHSFDVLSRLQFDIGAQGQSTQYTYDGNANLLTSTDPLGHPTGNLFDALNRLTQVLDPSLGTTTYDYDGANNLTQVTDPRGSSTSYTYDGLNNLTRLVSPDTGTTNHTYDAAGNLLTKTDARGVVATHTYDVLNRVKQVVYSKSGTPSETQVFTYDSGANAKGRLSAVTDPAAVTSWTYDSQGRVASKAQQVGSLIRTVAYGYNAAGQLTTSTTPSGQQLGYGYTNHRVSSITINGQSLVTGANTEPFGPLAAWQWGNGLLTFRDYDTDGRLSAWEFRNGSSMLRKNQSFDAASRITAIADPNHPPASQAYQYDELDRLTLAQSGNPVTNTQQFSYDAVGNRQNAIVDGAAAHLSYAPTGNRLQLMVGVSANYLNGASALSFAYNNANRQVQVQSSGVTIASYAVNALGQRVSKAAAGATTVFVYDEQGRLLGEYDGAGTLIQETVWLEELPVATLRPTGTGNPTPIAIYYVHADHLGSPRAVTRPSDNVMIWQWDNLDPFGVNLPNENPAGAGTFKYGLRFPGQYYDAETGTHYNYFRDYDPAIGRYEQSDPIGLDGGLNTFAYVKSKPLSYFDSQGLDTEVCIRRFYPVPAPWARHCFIRFNGDNNDTLSFDPHGVGADPNPKGGVCAPTKGPPNDDCVRREMKQCKAEQYDFTDFNCCSCAAVALQRCGLANSRPWPNWPADPPNYTPLPPPRPITIKPLEPS